MYNIITKSKYQSFKFIFLTCISSLSIFCNTFSVCFSSYFRFRNNNICSCWVLLDQHIFQIICMNYNDTFDQHNCSSHTILWNSSKFTFLVFLSDVMLSSWIFVLWIFSIICNRKNICIKHNPLIFYQLGIFDNLAWF